MYDVRREQKVVCSEISIEGFIENTGRLVNRAASTNHFNSIQFSLSTELVVGEGGRGSWMDGMKDESADILFHFFFFFSAGSHCEQFWHGQ